MNYFLGIDAGGTKTEFLLGNDEQHLARVRVGSIKRMRVSAEEARDNLTKALSELQQLSGVSPSAICHTCIGAAGNTVPLVTDWLRQAFSELVGGQLIITNDVEIALDAVFHGGRGLLALAGTGANFTARTSTGQIFRSGGWGPALDDTGSGYWLGSMGLRACFQAINQRRSTAMFQAALEHWNLNSIEEMVDYANRQPAPDFSKLAPLFVVCAEQGDADAQALMLQAGQLLAQQAIQLIAVMTEAEAPAPFDLPAVACIGSVLVKARPVREAFERTLQERFPGIHIFKEPADAAAGALWRARNAHTLATNANACSAA
jgi:N-acetylglucosamine kinase-like BadF-type ATPase